MVGIDSMDRDENYLILTDENYLILTCVTGKMLQISLREVGWLLSPAVDRVAL